MPAPTKKTPMTKAAAPAKKPGMNAGKSAPAKSAPKKK